MEKCVILNEIRVLFIIDYLFNSHVFVDAQHISTVVAMHPYI